jgi:hypothetical protein
VHEAGRATDEPESVGCGGERPRWAAAGSDGWPGACIAAVGQHRQLGRLFGEVGRCQAYRAGRLGKADDRTAASAGQSESTRLDAPCAIVTVGTIPSPPVISRHANTRGRRLPSWPTRLPHDRNPALRSAPGLRHPRAPSPRLGGNGFPGYSVHSHRTLLGITCHRLTNTWLTRKRVSSPRHASFLAVASPAALYGSYQRRSHLPVKRQGKYCC